MGTRRNEKCNFWGKDVTDKHPKRPRDVNQLAKMILDIATGEKPDRDRWMFFGRERHPSKLTVKQMDAHGISYSETSM